ncbi:exosortase/archaeosortase family protein [Algisphaera agarilytica]|uniref:Exosortase n=1 Tax=Algisphaera agarilytica TaxID=1385975 RepID=A0A7X0LJZ7_9BACT|nr:exosortase/archaeosortase family protein [Algisphaera agarilytica]MBB6429299.1 exosortase [Algisphaera agarilytica]
MTSTPMTKLAPAGQPQPLITPIGWAWIAVCLAFFGWMHWNFLFQTYLWSKDPDWSHVLIIPGISIYYIYLNKTRLQAAPKQLCWWALPLIFIGLYSYVFWIFPGRNDMFRGYSMVLTIFATALFLFGPAAMRVLWFPIAYLVLAVKVSDAIWSRIAERLQDIAAAGATVMLQLFSEFMDFTVDNAGNTITMGFWRDGLWVEEGMNVAEACAGLRMLMAFIALGVAMAFLFDRAWWQRLIMIGLAVPIAVLVNIGRVTALGLIYTVDKEYAQGDFHLFVGMLMLIPAAGLFLLVGWVLEKVIIRDPEAESKAHEKLVEQAAAQAALSKEEPKKVAPGLVAKGLVLGAALALVTGIVYAMLFNGFSARPVPGLEWMPKALSLIGVAVGLVILVGLALFARKSAPGRRGLATWCFAAAMICGLFGVAATGKQSILSWQKIVLHKEAVELRHNLNDLPLDKGPYSFIEDQILPPEIIDELGTEHYLSRWYRNTSIDEGQPGSLVRLHIAYYTGINDTVPHVPDRCFIAAGVKHKGLSDQTIAIDPEVATPRDGLPGYQATALLPLPGEPEYAPGTVVTLPEREINTVRFTYGPPDNVKEDQHVIYFFAANGKYLASPNAVRAQGFDIRDAHSYYCKIEIQVLGENDPDAVTRHTTDLLNVFLPDIMACLPDWDDVKAGRWPIQPGEPSAP